MRSLKNCTFIAVVLHTLLITAFTPDFPHSLELPSPSSPKLGETIESRILPCTSPNLTETWLASGDRGFECLSPYDANIMVLTMVFNQDYNPYGPPTFSIRDFFLAADVGIAAMTAANTTHTRLLTNQWSPYSADPFPAANWTSGSAVVYFEGPPCKGEWNYNEDEKGPYMEPARYADIAAGLRLLKEMVRNARRNDSDGVAWGEVYVVPKGTEVLDLTEKETVVGSFMVQNSEGKAEYRRWTYQRDLEIVCGDYRGLERNVSTVVVQ